MLYDGKNPLHAKQATLRLNKIIEKGAMFTLTEKKPKRTTNQNKYLHVILGYFAVETGNTIEYVKTEYFKKHCNPDIFVCQKADPYIGNINYLKSSADIDTAEMTTAIERFRNWSSQTAGIYLATPEDIRYIQLMELEIERNKQYL